MNECDIADCGKKAVLRCNNPECDLDVCEDHSRSDGKCIYCTNVGVEWDHEAIERFIKLAKDNPPHSKAPK